MGAPCVVNLPFKRLAWSNLLAQAAEQIGLATAPLLAVFLFHASTSETAMLQTIQSLPFLLLAIPAGLLADRSSRKTILALAEALRAFSFGPTVWVVAGATLAPWASRRFKFGSIVIFGPVGGLLGAITIAGSIWHPSFALAWVSFFFFGAGPILWTISTATLRQAITLDAP